MGVKKSTANVTIQRSEGGVAKPPNTGAGGNAD